jgi:hypothetical protein
VDDEASEDVDEVADEVPEDSEQPEVVVDPLL